MSLDVDDAAGIYEITHHAAYVGMVRHLNKRLESLRDELEISKTDPDTVARLQGRCEEIRNMLSLAASSEAVLKAQTR